MKIVIIGAKGMLGKDLEEVFFSPDALVGSGSRPKRRDFRPYLLDKEDLDITDKKSIQNVFLDLKPDVVINAAAYTDVDGCETNRDLAIKVNGIAPGYLAEASRDIGAVFIHYSTDYVFDGSKKEGYSEDDEPARSQARVAGGPGAFTRRGGGPVNFYGESKLAGEQAVREVGGSYYIIRTSWLYGVNGKNFVETILRQTQDKLFSFAQEIKSIKAVNDQHGKPTFSLDLARKTRELIEDKKDFGIYHITNESATTWYGFASEIIKQKSDSEKVIEVIPCSSDEFPRTAKRPQYSILKNTKLPPMRPWQEALAEYLSLRKK